MIIDLARFEWAPEDVHIESSVAAHLPGQHDQSSHGNWAGVSRDLPGTTMPTEQGRKTASEFVKRYWDEDPAVLKQRVAQGLAARIGDKHDAMIMDSTTMYDQDGNSVSLREDILGNPDAAVYFVNGELVPYSGGSFEPGTDFEEIRGDDPEFAAKIRESYVSGWVGAWAETSNSSAKSLAMQEIVAEEFGLTSAEWPLTDSMRAEVDKVKAAEGPFLRDFVHAQYEWTQSELGPGNNLTLYRGTTRILPEDATAIDNRPLSSWTYDVVTANTFASGGTVVSAGVPAERILATPMTGIGSAEELEFVILGTTTDTIKIENVDFLREGGGGDGEDWNAEADFLYPENLVGEMRVTSKVLGTNFYAWSDDEIIDYLMNNFGAHQSLAKETVELFRAQ